jgi:hypothetical protein
MHVRLNTHYDGPFDQLPENFIRGNDLKEAIGHYDPKVSKAVGRLGHLSAGTRYAIHPYMQYRRVEQLSAVHSCAMRRLHGSRYYRCFHNPPKDD